MGKLILIRQQVPARRTHQALGAMPSRKALEGICQLPSGICQLPGFKLCQGKTGGMKGALTHSTDMDRQGTLGEVASPLEASQPQASHQPKNDETQVPPIPKATAPPVGKDIASSIAHMQALFAKKTAAAAGAAMKRPAAAAGGAQKRKAIADSDVPTKGLVIPFPDIK